MDAVSDKVALIFAGNEPFEILASATRVIPVAGGADAQRLAELAAFTARRDDLGTTHHDAGTMRMGDAIADAVTNDFGRIRRRRTDGEQKLPTDLPTERPVLMRSVVSPC